MATEYGKYLATAGKRHALFSTYIYMFSPPRSSIFPPLAKLPHHAPHSISTSERSSPEITLQKIYTFSALTFRSFSSAGLSLLELEHHIGKPQLGCGEVVQTNESAKWGVTLTFQIMRITSPHCYYPQNYVVTHDKTGAIGI